MPIRKVCLIVDESPYSLQIVNWSINNLLNKLTDQVYIIKQTKDNKIAEHCGNRSGSFIERLKSNCLNKLKKQTIESFFSNAQIAPEIIDIDQKVGKEGIEKQIDNLLPQVVVSGAKGDGISVRIHLLRAYNQLGQLVSGISTLMIFNGRWRNFSTKPSLSQGQLTALGHFRFNFFPQMKQNQPYKHTKGHVLELLMFNFQPLIQSLTPLLPLARAVVKKKPLKGKMILYSPSMNIFKDLFGSISDFIFPANSIQLENELLKEQITFLQTALINAQKAIDSEPVETQIQRKSEKTRLLKLKDYFDMEIEGILEMLRFNEVIPGQLNLDPVQSWEQKNQLRIESKITQIYHIISQYKIADSSEMLSNEELVEILNQNFFHLKQLYTCLHSSKSLQIKQLKFSMAALQSEISLMGTAHQLEMDKLQKTLVEYEDMITKFMDADSISFATLQDLSQDKKLARSHSCPDFKSTHQEKIDYEKRSSNYFQARNNNPKTQKEISAIEHTIKDFDQSKLKLEASFESELESLKKLLQQRQNTLVNMKLSHQIELDRVYQDLSIVDQEITNSETAHHTQLQTLSPTLTNVHNCVSPTLTVDSLDYNY
ncbi:hypothetical protein HDV01_004498 [Terramyces sp. JEL0728]|nr:hypothetical protein HDV01_004498 [Terramyces sp. JEL0728]